jgi:hypothetical protein
MAERKPVDEARFPAIRATVVSAPATSGRKVAVIHCACGRDFNVFAWKWQGGTVCYCPSCSRPHKFDDYLKCVL